MLLGSLLVVDWQVGVPCGEFDDDVLKMEGSTWLDGVLIPLEVGLLRAVITVLYQAKGIAKVNEDRCDISSNKEIIIVI